VPDLGASLSPPRETWQRAVVATREPRSDRTPVFEAKRAKSQSQPRREPPDDAPPGSGATGPSAAPPTRVVTPARDDAASQAPKRPPFGRHSDDLRRMPPPAPRFQDVERSASGETRSRVREAAGSRPERAAEPSAPERRSVSPPRDERRDETRTRSETRNQPATPTPRTDPSRERVGGPAPGRSERLDRRERPSTAELPGEPANRVYREERRLQGSQSWQNERTRPSQPGRESQREHPQRSWGGDSERGERGSMGPR